MTGERGQTSQPMDLAFEIDEVDGARSRHRCAKG
jgi:hypothetical protein